jgi:hypothetical protein
MSTRERQNRLARDKQRKIIERPYVVGDSVGEINSVLPGKFLVREQYANNLFGPAVSVWGPKTGLTLTAGMAINLTMNSKGEPVIDGVDHARSLSQGIVPSSYTQITQANPYQSQQNFTTLKICAETGLSVALQGWRPVYEQTCTSLSFPGLDLTSYLPSAGLMAMVLLGVLADLSGVEIVSSTPRSSTGLDLGDADVSEALALLAPGSTPTWALPLTSDLTSLPQDWLDAHARDLRQMVNSAPLAGVAILSGGTIAVSCTAVTANSLVLLTAQETGTLTGFLRVSLRNPGIGFTITSSGGTDTAHVAWMVIR